MLHCALDESVFARSAADTDLLAGQHDKTRDVDRARVHLDVTVPDQLACRLSARRESEAVDHVVQSTLQRRQQVMSGDARKRGDMLERVSELLFRNPVNAFDLLLLAKLLGVFG